MKAQSLINRNERRTLAFWKECFLNPSFGNYSRVKIRSYLKDMIYNAAFGHSKLRIFSIHEIIIFYCDAKEEEYDEEILANNNSCTLRE